MPTEDTLEDIRQYLHRTIRVERVVLFVKAAVIAFAFMYTVVGVGRLRGPLPPHEPILRSVEIFKWQLLLYTVGNAIFWFCLFVLGRRIARYQFIKTTAFLLVLVDTIFVSLLLSFQGDPVHSTIFWVYCAVIVHTALLFPKPLTQATMTLVSAAFYVGAVAFNIGGNGAELLRQNEAAVMGRLLILALAGVTCWGANAFVQERKRALDELHERVIRTEKLKLAALIASSVAHELKNPLAIMNNAAFILNRHGDKLDPKLRKQIETITMEIERSDRIITDLIGYAKLADGKIDRVKVNAVLDEAIADLKNEIDGRNIVVAKTYTRHLPRLFIDRKQLRTMVSNILLNACESIVSLGRITVSTGYSDDGSIEIAIADTGTGISEENLPKVFESFFTTKSSGTGLGLSIVNSIVKAYGGSVTVESHEAKGSRFTVRLPTRTVPFGI